MERIRRPSPKMLTIAVRYTNKKHIKRVLRAIDFEQPLGTLQKMSYSNTFVEVHPGVEFKAPIRFERIGMQLCVIIQSKMNY
jgi:hypothetical protein